MPCCVRYPAVPVLLLLCFVWASTAAAAPLSAANPQTTSDPPTCRTPYRLDGALLKDHTIFSYAGWYYLVSIRIDLPRTDDRGEERFAAARTRDFCEWETLDTPLAHGTPGDPDEAYVWAPFVMQVGETFYMYYTGVNDNLAQTILLATSTDPADPQSWQKQDMLFWPDHPAAVYPGPDAWADARDPFVLADPAHNERYLLYYTGRDDTGGMVGMAYSTAPAGPWRDLGAVFHAPGDTMPESPSIVSHAGYYYLFVSLSGPTRQERRWYWSVSPSGPWQAGERVSHGWAHDFYQAEWGWLASYVVGNGESIRVVPLDWRTSSDPPAPAVGYRLLLSLVLNE